MELTLKMTVYMCKLSARRVNVAITLKNLHLGDERFHVNRVNRVNQAAHKLCRPQTITLFGISYATPVILVQLYRTRVRILMHSQIL